MFYLKRISGRFSLSLCNEERIKRKISVVVFRYETRSKFINAYR